MSKAIGDMKNESIEYGENKRTIEIAKNLINIEILSLEQIAQVTGLSLDKVKELTQT